MTYELRPLEESLVPVSFPELGHALGGQLWTKLAGEVRTAAAAAIALGLCCSGVLYLAEDALLGSSDGSTIGLFKLTAHARVAATPLYRLRLCSVPALFVQRVGAGLLGGLQVRSSFVYHN